MVPHNKELSASTEAEQRVESSGFDKSRSVVTSRCHSLGTKGEKKKHILFFCRLSDKCKKYQTNFFNLTFFVIDGFLLHVSKEQSKYLFKKNNQHHPFLYACNTLAMSLPRAFRCSPMDFTNFRIKLKQEANNSAVLVSLSNSASRSCKQSTV